MRRLFLFLGLGILATIARAESQPKEQTRLPVETAVLFSSGVGYFQHSGTVKGDTSAELRFKTHQINDILKSLVLEDLDGGKIGSIVYPSQDPISKTLRSFQVDITNNPPLGELLNQLRGTKVKVQAQAEMIEGTILGLEQKEKIVGEDDHLVKTWMLNLVTDGSVRAISLEECQKIELEDSKLQEELNQALLALSQARDQDKKPVTIHFKGNGERRVRLAYVVETPVWKTSYRLILPEKVGEKARLQGWAIVENQTDNDWDNIKLSLVSGRPISFIQEMYQPLYISRPVVQPELYASLRPQTYEAGMELRDNEGMLELEYAPKAAPAPAMGGRGFAQAPAATLRRAEKPFDPFSSVSLASSGAKVGELFQYTVENVSLPRQRSAMIPIVSDEVEAERLSIYNKNVMPKNPLNGARIKNTSGKHLLQGPITVFDENAYAGDASIDNLPPGQERLLSYAIDLEVNVDAANLKEEDLLQTAKIVKGSLVLTRKEILSQEYVVENKSDKNKTIIIEHPFRSGWELVDSPTPIEKTDVLYRFKDSVLPGKTSKLTVKEEYIHEETIAILPADFGQLEFYSQTGEIPKKVRDVLMKAMKLESVMTDTDRKIQEREKDLSNITEEQQRIRSNMNTVNSNSQYYTRLLAKLNDQETKIEKLQEEIEELKQTYEGQRKDLEDYLSNLNVE